jgi:hypothetical protein
MVHYPWSYACLKIWCPILFSSIWACYDEFGLNDCWSLIHMKNALQWCNCLWFLECFGIFWKFAHEVHRLHEEEDEDHVIFQISYELAMSLLRPSSFATKFWKRVAGLGFYSETTPFHLGAHYLNLARIRFLAKEFFSNCLAFSHIPSILPCLFMFWFQIFPKLHKIITNWKIIQINPNFLQNAP